MKAWLMATPSPRVGPVMMATMFSSRISNFPSGSIYRGAIVRDAGRRQPHRLGAQAAIVANPRLRGGILGLEGGRSWAAKAQALADDLEIVGVANTIRASAEA